MKTYEFIIFTVKLSFVGLAILAILWVAVRPLWRMLNRKEDYEDVMRIFTPPLDDEKELQIPTEGAEVEKPSREAILAKLKSDPHHTAMMLKQVLRDKGRSR